MLTRITLVNGEKLEVELSLEEVIKKTTNKFGQIYNDYVQIADNIWIATAHIVKLERISC